MSQEGITNFLKLAGVGGCIVIDGSNRPYCYFQNTPLSEAHQMAIAQGIYQVIQTTPAECYTFEFQFSTTQIQIHKVMPDLLLLTLLHPADLDPAYPETLRAFVTLLQTDRSTTLQTLASLPNLANPHPPISPPPTLQEILAAINELSQFTSQYLGTVMVNNYWKNSRPQVEWLNLFQLDRQAQMCFSIALSSRQSRLTSEQYQWLQEWVAEFMKQCTQVIRNYPKLVNHGALNEQQKALLFKK